MESSNSKTGDLNFCNPVSAQIYAQNNLMFPSPQEQGSAKQESKKAKALIEQAKEAFDQYRDIVAIWFVHDKDGNLGGEHEVMSQKTHSWGQIKEKLYSLTDFTICVMNQEDMVIH